MSEETTVVAENEAAVEANAAEQPAAETPAPAPKMTVEQLLAEKERIGALSGDALTAAGMTPESRDKALREIRRKLRAQGHYVRGPRPQGEVTAEASANGSENGGPVEVTENETAIDPAEGATEDVALADEGLPEEEEDEDDEE